MKIETAKYQQPQANTSFTVHNEMPTSSRQSVNKLNSNNKSLISMSVTTYGQSLNPITVKSNENAKFPLIPKGSI